MWEIRLVGGGSEATMIQEPDISDVGRDGDLFKPSRLRPH